MASPATIVSWPEHKGPQLRQECSLFLGQEFQNSSTFCFVDYEMSSEYNVTHNQIVSAFTPKSMACSIRKSFEKIGVASHGGL